MSARAVDQTNRVLFGVLGLLLLAAGIFGLLVRGGAFTVDEPSALYDRAIDNLRDLRGLKIGLLLLGLLLILLGLRYARRQIGKPAAHLHELTLEQDKIGRTTIDADTVSRALTTDLEHLPAIQSASAKVVSAGPTPRVLVRVSVDEDADLPAVRSSMEGAYGRVCQVLGIPAVQTEVHVKPVPSRRSRVV